TGLKDGVVGPGKGGLPVRREIDVEVGDQVLGVREPIGVVDHHPAVVLGRAFSRGYGHLLFRNPEVAHAHSVQEAAHSRQVARITHLRIGEDDSAYVLAGLGPVEQWRRGHRPGRRSRNRSSMAFTWSGTSSWMK